jgi:hypothetical protein
MAAELNGALSGASSAIDEQIEVGYEPQGVLQIN